MQNHNVIVKRSEESHKSLISQSLRLRKSSFQSYYQQADSMTRDKLCYQQVDSMTEKSKDVIGNHLIKEDLYLNGNDKVKF